MWPLLQTLQAIHTPLEYLCRKSVISIPNSTSYTYTHWNIFAERVWPLLQTLQAIHTPLEYLCRKSVISIPNPTSHIYTIGIFCRKSVISIPNSTSYTYTFGIFCRMKYHLKSKELKKTFKNGPPFLFCCSIYSLYLKIDHTTFELLR